MSKNAPQNTNESQESIEGEKRLTAEEYLQHINPPESKGGQLLERLKEKGITGEELLRHTDIWGNIVEDNDSPYMGRGCDWETATRKLKADENADAVYDPDFFGPYLEALQERREFMETIVIPAVQREVTKIEGLSDPQHQMRYIESAYPEAASYLKSSFINPPQNPLQETRQTILHQLETKKRPAIMTTHEQYMEYFKGFESEENWNEGKMPVLTEIMKNIGFIEISKGCDAPCRNICALPTRSAVKAHIPFETIEWIFKNFADQLPSPSLYYGSDIKYYQYKGKTGVDVLEAYQKYIGRIPYNSTVFGLDEASVEFIFQMVIKADIPVDRLSCLVTGKNKKFDPKERFIAKLRKKIAKEPLEISEDEKEKRIAMVEKAIENGEKGDMNTVLGNSIHAGTKEADISKSAVNCKQQVLITTEGLKGVVLSLPTKKTPYGETSYPINFDPQKNQYSIPPHRHVDDTSNPLATNLFISGPEIRPLTKEGKSMYLDQKKYGWKDLPITQRETTIFTNEKKALLHYLEEIPNTVNKTDREERLIEAFENCISTAYTAFIEAKEEFEKGQNEFEVVALIALAQKIIAFVLPYRKVIREHYKLDPEPTFSIESIVLPYYDWMQTNKETLHAMAQRMNQTLKYKGLIPHHLLEEPKELKRENSQPSSH